MLIYLVSRIISSTGAFLYPTYASYKALSKRPASEADIERWLMYWSVVGTLVGVEYVAEWSISWIPFYHLLKTIFLLYLALPQTRGASYMYTTHLYPFLASHETEIDASLVRTKDEALRWVQTRLRGVWELLAGFNTNAGAPSAHPGPIADTVSPPTMNDPATGSAQLISNLWNSYGPMIAAFLQPQPQPTQAPPEPRRSPLPSSKPSLPSGQAPPFVPRPVPTPTRGTTSAIDAHQQYDPSSLLARRRALEAELASLPLPNPHEGEAPGFPVPQTASSTYLPAQGDERGRYEEIQKDEADDEEGQGVEYARPRSGRTSSWWWGAGYERVKTE